jgi:methylmalonyl-CoA mutase N-terminal domain/subunit
LGYKKVVVVNTLTGAVDSPLEILRVSHEVEREQVATLTARKAERDDVEVQRRLATMIEVAQGDGNLIPPMLEAIRAEATLGEVCGALKVEWGVYRDPGRF